ncbi:MAG: YCF48-related protein [Methylococcaceae bacterium]
MSITFFIRLLLIVLINFNIASVFAHVPHDVTDTVVSSPNNSNEVYTIVRSNLLKSTDKGLTWQRLVQGLDNKSVLKSLTINPNRPNNLYISTFSDGIYQSTDKGKSWHKINQGLTTLNFTKLYIPKSINTQTIFAAAGQGGLYKLTTNNANWIKIYDKSIIVTALAELSSNNPKNYTLLIGDKTGALLSSINGSNNWQKLYQFSNCGQINTIATSPNPLFSNTLLVATSLCGILRSTDAGQSFNAVNTGILDLNIRSIVISPDNQVFAASYSQAIFISSDLGLTWQKNSDEITISKAGSAQANAAQLPMFTDIAISADFTQDKTLFLSSFDGLFRSTNGGNQWQQLDTLPLSLIQAIALSPTYTQDATVMLTTYDNGVYKSNNAGHDWQGIADNIDGRNYDIAFSPHFITDKTLFISNSNDELGMDIIGKSTDGGLTWSSHSLPSLHSGSSIIALSPAFINDATLFVGSRHGLIYRSIDGGENFKIIFNDSSTSCDGCISSIAISPHYAVDKTIIIASATGIYISKDGGDNWLLKTSPKAFNLVKTNSVKLFISPNYAIDHSIFIATPQGLFKTDNEFNSVQKISANLTDVNSYITQIALSPNYAIDNTLIMTIKGKGLFQSKDAGLSFQLLNPKFIASNRNFELWDGFPIVSSSVLVFSPNYAVDKTIFAANSNQVFRSEDGGQNWKSFIPAK